MAAPDATGPALGGAALLAALGGVLGPLVAEWAVVLAAAVIGSGIAASHLETKTVGTVWWLVVRGVGMSLLFTAFAAGLASKAAGLHAVEILWPLSGLIAWQQERVLSLARLLLPKKGPTHDG